MDEAENSWLVAWLTRSPFLVQSEGEFFRIMRALDSADFSEIAAKARWDDLMVGGVTRWAPPRLVAAGQIMHRFVRYGLSAQILGE